MLDYTESGEIVRGGAWPPGEAALRAMLTRDEGVWDEGADRWTWDLIFSRTQRGGKADLVVAAESAHVAGKVLTLIFHLTGTQTGSLPKSRKVLLVELRSDDGTPGGAGVNYYGRMSGSARVRDPVGEG